MARAEQCLLVVVASALAATVAAEAPFMTRVRAAAPTAGWVGYAVPGLPGTRLCSGACSSKRACRLEGDEEWIGDDGRERGAAPPGGEPLRIYLRWRAGRVERARLFSQSCSLDTRGVEVAWLDDVTPTESLAALAELARNEDRPSADGALAALAHHADAGATAWLERYVARGGPARLREQAAFWLGHLRGQRGFQVLLGLLGDPDRQFREHVVFAISQSPLAEAQDELFRLARTSQDPALRGRALFWLGQRAGERALDTLARAAADDPDVEVKRQAVFGLSQLPAKEGVPQLVRIARTHRQPEVRQAALFWLGQSGDPLALTLLEEVLR